MNILTIDFFRYIVYTICGDLIFEKCKEEYSAMKKIVDNFCLWEDLLGFGSPLYKNNWNLENIEVENNLKRLEILQTDALLPNDIFIDTIFTLNDGYVRCSDMPSDSLQMLLWIKDTIVKFYRMNLTDKSYGYPGIRGVLSFGQRFVYANQSSHSMGEFIQTTEERRKTLYQKNIVLAPLELQMNTAFSKAYIIEESGSRAGVKGPNLFIDENAITAICDFINKHNVYELVLTQEDFEKYGDQFYTYNASFELNTDKPQLRVMCQIDDTIWEAFKIVFTSKIPYNNEQCSIHTNLFIPSTIFDSITSPYTLETITVDTLESEFQETREVDT